MYVVGIDCYVVTINMYDVTDVVIVVAVTGYDDDVAFPYAA